MIASIYLPLEVLCSMDNIFEAVKEELKRDEGFPETWQTLSALVDKAGPQIELILKWIFTEYKGYTYTRARAGIRYYTNAPSDAWPVIEQLVLSSDPDDRDTALEVLKMSGDPRALDLAKLLLKDPYPYLQLDAADYLRALYPDEVAVVLRDLLNHKDKRTRETAKNLLISMGESIT